MLMAGLMMVVVPPIRNLGPRIGETESHRLAVGRRGYLLNVPTMKIAFTDADLTRCDYRSQSEVRSD